MLEQSRDTLMYPPNHVSLPLLVRVYFTEVYPPTNYFTLSNLPQSHKTYI